MQGKAELLSAAKRESDTGRHDDFWCLLFDFSTWKHGRITIGAYNSPQAQAETYEDVQTIHRLNDDQALLIDRAISTARMKEPRLFPVFKFYMLWGLELEEVAELPAMQRKARQYGLSLEYKDLLADLLAFGEMVRQALLEILEPGTIPAQHTGTAGSDSAGRAPAPHLQGSGAA